MKVILYQRDHGLHSPVKEATIEGEFSDYFKGEDQIEEELLLNNLPEGFLPIKSQKVLLTVQTNYGSRGQRGLKQFMNWSKYFDSYVIELGNES